MSDAFNCTWPTAEDNRASRASHTGRPSPGWPDTALLGSTAHWEGYLTLSIIRCCSQLLINTAGWKMVTPSHEGYQFVEEKKPNTQKPLKNKNSRTQTIQPSQDTRRANVSLGRNRRNKPGSGELDFLHPLATCLQDFHQLAQSIPEKSQALAQPLALRTCRTGWEAARMLEPSERKCPVLAAGWEPPLASS